MATQMVASAANTLYDQGLQTLYSAYHICNEGSRDWQHSFGFVEILDPFYCRLKYAWYSHEIWRRERLGINEDVSELETEKDRWYSQLRSRAVISSLFVPINETYNSYGFRDGVISFLLKLTINVQVISTRLLTDDWRY